MKKIILFSLLLTFLLTGCAKDDTDGDNLSIQPISPAVSSDSPKNAESETTASQENTVFTAKVLKNYEKSLLLADIDGGLDTIFEVSAFEDGIAPGDIVSVSYNGFIMETYPCQLGQASAALKENGADLVGMYEDIFTELLQRDSGLNSGVEVISLDLSGIDNLSKTEKEGLFKIIEDSLISQGNIRLVSMTLEQLKEENMLSYQDGDDKFPHFENGLLFTFPTENESEKDFELTATKWRSPLGAYGFNIKASLKDNTWQYKIENEFIS